MKNIRIGQKEIIHFIGIGGIGMSGLAQVMKTMGFKIQGSDQNKNKNTKAKRMASKIFCFNFYVSVDLKQKIYVLRCCQKRKFQRFFCTIKI